MGRAAFGYKILYGPLLIEAPLLVLGAQPGGGAADASIGEQEGERIGWPAKCEYASADWALARQLRKIWASSQLEKTTGLNLNFFRSPDDSEWKALSRGLREEVEIFCRAAAQTIVESLRPKRILVLGLGTFDRFSPRNGADLRVANARLASDGTIWGIPAVGVMHLSGARISREKREILNAHLRERIPL